MSEFLPAPAPEALEGMGWAAWWLEDVPGCLDSRERAYRMYRRAGDARGAARVALWLGDAYIEFRGATAVADGWFGRAARILDGLGPTPEHGWLAARLHDTAQRAGTRRPGGRAPGPVTPRPERRSGGRVRSSASVRPGRAGARPYAWPARTLGSGPASGN